MHEQQKILIVDDKEANLVALRQVLKVLPAEVHPALDGNQALALTLEHDFAVAILDVQMPGMDGYELAEVLRAERRTSDVPILFVSAVYTEDFHVFKGYEAGAVDFMAKPLRPEWLLSKVRVFLELHRQRGYYLAMLEALGGSLAETQDALRRAMANAHRQRTTARLIRRLTSLLEDMPSEAELEAAFLRTFLETTGMDRAMLLRRDPDGRTFTPGASLGLGPGQRDALPAPAQPVAFAHAHAGTPDDGFAAALRQTLGVPHLLWACDDSLGQALLAGNAAEDAQTRPAFTPEDNVIVSSALRVLGLIDRQRRSKCAWEMLLAISEVLMRSANGALGMGIQAALEKLCRFAGADRCHLVQVLEEGEILDSIHEWRRPGIASHWDNLRGSERDETFRLLENLSGMQPVLFHRTTANPRQHHSVQAAPEAADIRSTLLMPLAEEGRLMGLIGMDWVARGAVLSSELIPLLQLGADIVQNALRLEQNQKLRLASEQARLKAEAAEAASQAKSAFLANMSHEIRTPMNAILGFAQVLELDPSLDDEQAERVRIINRNGKHLLGLINEVLDMSRIEAGQVRLQPHDFGLHDLLDDLEVTFRPHIEAHGLQMCVHREQGLPERLHADETKLRQVLVNLLGNAVKFTGSGEVSLGVRRISPPSGPSWHTDRLRLAFEVRDTGPGIAAKDRERIFEAFHQTLSGAEAGGTGLGLPICRRYVEMMGGSLTVESTLGLGSVFRFDIQARVAEGDEDLDAPRARRVVGIMSRSDPVRVLVADDNPENRALFRDILEPAGFAVTEAGSGQEALDLIDRQPPHAVIMDMRMPGMDGWEAIRRLNSSGHGRSVPIIASTAYAFDGEQAEIMAAGAHAYLRKPFRMDELFALLGDLLRLEYLYEAVQEPIPATPHHRPESIDDLPADLLAALHEAAECGDTARLKELIAQAATMDSQVAAPLLALTNNYDLATLQEWLGGGKGGEG